MKKIISVVAVAVALTAVLPAANAQQADPPKQSLTARLKQKYLERRAKFMHRVKDVYFAVGCKVLAGGAGIQPLTGSDSYLAFVGDQTIVDLKDGLWPTRPGNDEARSLSEDTSVLWIAG